MGAILSEPVTAVAVDRSASEFWTAASATMQGWRRTHEDAHIFEHSAGGVEPSGVFAVLDGHGGCAAAHQSAAILKEKLVQMARRGTLSASSAEPELERIFIDADRQLRKELPPEERSGTTVVSAVITRCGANDFCVQLAHSGDSRAVLCTKGQIICSEDHKPGREDETRRIVAAGGTVAPGALGGGPMRVDGALAVSRAMGDFQFKPAGMDPVLCKVTALPEVATVTKVAEGDWLLLACDGIFDVFNNEEIREFIAPRIQAAAPEPADGGKIVAELLEACLDKGSKDNCTACLVQLHSSRPLQPSSRELLHGKWATAAPDIKVKYEEFCVMEGFEEQARSMRSDSDVNNSPHVTATASTPSSAPVQQTSSTGSGQSQSSNQKIVAITKALAAMRSSRAIQTAWRSSRSGSDVGDSPNAGSAADTGAHNSGQDALCTERNTASAASNPSSSSTSL